MKVSFRRLAYNIFFRFSPILIVVLIELSLRFLGVGESYLLFQDSPNGQHSVLNQLYYRRFVSAEQFPNVEILPQEISKEKAENTYRIFLIGDQTLCSAFPDVNREQILEDFQDETGMNYDIVQLAVPYTNSFAIKRLIKCVNKYDADACVLITGGNEYYGLPKKSPWMQDINNYLGLGCYVTMKNHRFVQVLERFIYTKKDPKNAFPPNDIDQWTIGYDSEINLEVKDYFNRNLKKISKKSQSPVFLVSLPVNIKARPYRSQFIDKELNDEDFAKECAVLVANADPFTIDRWIDDLEAWEPETAIYYYCKAMIAEHENNVNEALEYYKKALETDAFKVRMNRDLLSSIKYWSNEEQIELIDLYEASMSMSNKGLTINKFFVDGIKLNEKGRELFISELRSSLIDYFNQ